MVGAVATCCWLTTKRQFCTLVLLQTLCITTELLMGDDDEGGDAGDEVYFPYAYRPYYSPINTPTPFL